VTQESLTASRRVAAGLWLAFNWRGLSQVCVDLRHLLGSVRLTMSMSSSLWFTLALGGLSANVLHEHHAITISGPQAMNHLQTI
jgi:hypothetical protein